MGIWKNFGKYFLIGSQNGLLFLVSKKSFKIIK